MLFSHKMHEVLKYATTGRTLKTYAKGKKPDKWPHKQFNLYQMFRISKSIERESK